MVWTRPRRGDGRQCKQCNRSLNPRGAGYKVYLCYNCLHWCDVCGARHLGASKQICTICQAFMNFLGSLHRSHDEDKDDGEQRRARIQLYLERAEAKQPLFD